VAFSGAAPGKKRRSHQGEPGREDGAHIWKIRHAVKRAVTHFAAFYATDARLLALAFKMDSTPKISPNFALSSAFPPLPLTCRAILPPFARLQADRSLLVRLSAVGSRSPELASDADPGVVTTY